MTVGRNALRDEVGRASVYHGCISVLGLLGSVVFARTLGPEAFGNYFLLYALVGISDRAVSGVGEAAKKRISGGAVDANEAVGATIATAAGAGVLSAILGVAGDEWLSAFVGITHAGWWYAVLVTCLGTFESLQVVVTASGRVGREKLYDLVHRFDTLLLQYAGVVMIGGPAGMAAGLAGATVVAVQLPARHVSAPAVPSTETLASLWRYARYAVAERLTVGTWNRINLVLLGWLATSGVTGEYTVAADLTTPGLFVVSAAAAGVMARTSDRHRNGQSVSPAITDALGYASILAVPLLAIVLAVPEHLVVVLYNERYASAVPLVVGLAVYQLLVSLSRPIAATLKGIDRPDLAAGLSVAGLALDVVLGVVLYFLLGPVGVVVATIVAQSAWVVGATSLLREQVDAMAVPVELGVQFLGGVGAYAVAAGIAGVIPGRTLPALTAAVVPAVLVYALVLGSFSQTRRLLRDLLPIPT